MAETKTNKLKHLRLSYRVCILAFIGSMVFTSGLLAQGKLELERTVNKDSVHDIGHHEEMDQSLENDSGIWLYKKRLKEAVLSGNDSIVFDRLNLISEYLFYKGNYDSALVYLNQALILSYKVKNAEWSAASELHIGNVLLSRLEYINGMAHYLKALDWADKDKNKGALQGSISQKIAEVYIRMRQYPEALHYLDIAELKALKYKNEFLLTFIYVNRGNLYADKIYNDKAKSNRYLNMAYAIAKKNQWRQVIQNVLLSLVRNDIDAGDFQGGLNHLAEAESVFNTNDGGKIQLLIFRAKCYLGLGDMKAVERNVIHAKQLAEPKHKFFLSAIYRLYSTVEEKKGHFESALTFYKKGKLYQDSIEGDHVKDSIVSLQYKYQMVQKDNELIKNKLFIQHQEAIIYRKNYLTYTVIAICILILTTSWLMMKYKQSRLKQKNELIAWKAKVDGVETERARMATILHDTIGATLSTAIMWFKNALGTDDKLRDNHEYMEGMKLLNNSIEAIRTGSHHLMPDLLKRLGLIEAIAVYCDSVSKAETFHIEYQHYGSFDDVNDEMALVVYRSIQELMQNVIKYAGATNVTLQLSCHGTILGITLEDNGSGFDINNLKHTKGIGLQNIKSNTKYHDGQFSITSEIGVGTTAYIEYTV